MSPQDKNILFLWSQISKFMIPDRRISFLHSAISQCHLLSRQQLYLWYPVRNSFLGRITRKLVNSSQTENILWLATCAEKDKIYKQNINLHSNDFHRKPKARGQVGQFHQRTLSIALLSNLEKFWLQWVDENHNVVRVQFCTAATCLVRSTRKSPERKAHHRMLGTLQPGGL